MGYLEKRRSPRVQTNNFISYYLLDEDDKIYSEGFGKARDISDVGLLMVTGKIVESSHILLVATDERHNIIEMKGRVSHSRKDDTGVIFTGVEFLGDRAYNAKFANHLKNAHRMSQDSSSLSLRS